ncbi:MAG: universal stress protein [Cyanobacteria bacterium SZAS LIN-3]|nr:universal stress protein [Cyanobacteria bacterium SZAS LIN-3]
MKVLAPIDDSPCSKRVLEHLATQPWWGDTEFLILNVVEVPALTGFPDCGFVVDAEWLNKLSAFAQELVAREAATLQEKLGNKLKIEHRVVQGRAGQAVVDTAREWGADLIIMGSHGRSGLEKLLMGSVAEAVIAAAPCSVEIVKEKTTTTKSKKTPAKAASSK